MIPGFFAYDRINYSRYAPVYLLEMANLESTHPDIYRDMSNGGFVVQRQQRYGFAQVPVDQTIEQTVNRDSKTKGGMTGITMNKGAVHRWILSYPARAEISSRCSEMAGTAQDGRKRKDLDESRISKDEKAVQNIVTTVKAMCNPFSVADEGIINLASGSIASEDIQKDLGRAEEVGQLAFRTFVDERLDGDEKDIYTPIKLQKLKTFSDKTGKVTANDPTSKVPLKANTDILGRIIVIGKSRNVNMTEALKYSLHPYPPAVATNDGPLTKTVKSKLREHLLKSQSHQSQENHLQDVQSTAWVLDGMALIRELKDIPSTFRKLAEKILEKVISVALQHRAERVDFVPDRYPEHSIKGGERTRRAATGSQRIRITGPDQKTPRQFKKFLMCGENKEQLLEFLFSEWQTSTPEKLQGVQFIVGHGDQCHQLKTVSGIVECLEIPELSSDHEEADSRMLLHANHAATQGKANVIIRSQDTDVFVLATAFSKSLNGAILYMHIGPWSNSQIINMNLLSEELGESISNALVGFHCFTGCDSCSAFKGRGKLKAYAILMKNQQYQEMFKGLGGTWELDENLLPVIERFVCELYGMPGEESVDSVRDKIFKRRFKVDATMPPNRDALVNHTKRVNYQAAIFQRCMENKLDSPSPVGLGWTLEKDDLMPLWNSIPYAPESLSKYVACACQKSLCRENSKCSCQQNDLPCTEMCRCVGCTNDHDHTRPDVQDPDISDPDDSDLSDSE